MAPKVETALPPQGVTEEEKGMDKEANKEPGTIIVVERLAKTKGGIPEYQDVAGDEELISSKPRKQSLAECHVRSAEFKTTIEGDDEATARLAAEIVTKSFLLTEVAANQDPTIAKQNQDIAEQRKLWEASYYAEQATAAAKEALTNSSSTKSSADEEKQESEANNRIAEELVNLSFQITMDKALQDPAMAEENRQIAEQKQRLLLEQPITVVNDEESTTARLCLDSPSGPPAPRPISDAGKWHFRTMLIMTLFAFFLLVAYYSHPDVLGSLLDHPAPGELVTTSIQKTTTTTTTPTVKKIKNRNLIGTFFRKIRSRTRNKMERASSI